jgi:hypothetical protein
MSLNLDTARKLVSPIYDALTRRFPAQVLEIDPVAARQCPVLQPREIRYKCIRHNLSQLLLVLLAPLLANGRVRR